MTRHPRAGSEADDALLRVLELELMSYHVRTMIVIGAVIGFTLASGLHVYGQKPVNERRGTSVLRQNAVMLLDSTIDELAAVEDVEARVTFSEEIVKLLAGSKPERCRHMLDALFNDLMKLKTTDFSQSKTRRANPDALIRKLIKAAAAFDSKLAQSYVDRYTEEASGQKIEQATSTESSPLQADLNMALALQLIETDPDLAVRVAERAVKTAVTARALEFLGTLRKKNVGLADAFFITSLQSVRARQGTDINELLLLYTYIFSPTRVFGLNSQGLVLRQIPGYQEVAQDYPVNRVLAQQFLQVSAQILLVDIQYRQSSLGPAAGAMGDLYFINLIKPPAATYTPSLFGPLSEQGNMLVSYLQPEQNSRLQSDVERLSSLPDRAGEGLGENSSTVESLLGRADAMPSSTKRDYLYYMAAMTAIREKRYDIASEIGEHISAGAQAEIKGFIDFSIAQHSVDEQQLEKAEQWAQRDTDLTRRAYMFTLIANSLLDDGKDYARAAKFLTDAELLAAKLDSAHEGFAILIREAEIYSRFDSLRASETLRQAFKATASDKGFTGDGRVSRRLDIGDFSFFYEMFNDRLSLSRAVNRLASKDFYGTLSTIRELQNPVLRLRAVISLCSGILAEGHSNSSSTTQPARDQQRRADDLCLQAQLIPSVHP